MELDALRQRLLEADRKILEAVAERQVLVAEIGRTKLQSGVPLRDFQREKEVLEQARHHAAAFNVDLDLAEEIVRALIRSALTRQEQARVAASGQGTGRSALIIGGAGKMGRWFGDFLDSQGYRVEISDPAGPVEGFGFRTDWEAPVPPHDLVVVAASLAASARILHRLAELRPPGLIFDVGSLKSPLIPGLQALAATGCRVTSLHPMFGPDTRLLSGRHVLFCDAGHPEATAEARAIFDSTMAQQIEMPLAAHDRFVAYVLGVSHALNIAFVSALAGSGEDAPALARLSSTTFDAQLEVASRVVRENPHLYYEIQALNAYGDEALRSLERAVAQVAESVRARDEPGFVLLMEKGRAYLEGR